MIQLRQRRFLFPVAAAALFALCSSRAQAGQDPASKPETSGQDPTFKSEVSMSRIDARVIDRDGHAVMGLLADDFVLRLDGKDLPVKNFANENTPIDILLLLDVSGSMEPHVERIAMAASQALTVLGDQDRVGIMVFDSRTRVRLPFRSNRGDVTRELNKLLDAERFNGGTLITSAMVDAARYVEREARPEARRAIVILTDDMTQDRTDEGRVEAALRKAKAVMSFLRAPYDETGGFSNGGPVPRRGGGGGGPVWGSGGGGWPGGGGGGMGWPGGGGGGWPGGGGGWPGGRGGGGGGPMGGGIPGGYSPSHSADTETIALESGGDVMNVTEAAALEDTLARLRQRYALYFYLPEGMASRGRSVQVNLAEHASLRYHGAEIQSRRVFMTGGEGSAEPATVTHVKRPPEPAAGSGTAAEQSTGTTTAAASSSPRRNRAVNESSGTTVHSVGAPPEASSNSSSTGSSAPPATNTSSPPAQKGGWPRATDKPAAPPNQFASMDR